MYCKHCGALLNERAEMCVNCGCRPLTGNRFCQHCGVSITDKQDMCVKCGCMLKNKGSFNKTNILDGISIGNKNDNQMDLDFSDLSPYYQKEFTKIYNSNEEYKGKFNGWAFFWGAVWGLTKGLWLPAIVAVVISILTAGVGGVVYWFIFAFRGNYMYYRSYVNGKQCVY